MNEDEVRLQHMLDAALKASQFAYNKERDDLDSDEMLLLAEVRLIEIIGEAAARISKETRLMYPNVPWREIIATRNRLIHGYYHVDPDIVWSIIKDDLPSLIEELNR